MENIIVIGGGGHSKVVISILKKMEEISILGYTDEENRGTILNIGYLGNDDVFLDLINSHSPLVGVLGLGHIRNDDIKKRKILRNNLESLGVQFPPIISPDALINENVEIGSGSVVMDGVIINSCSKIGENAIVNTGAIIEHDSILEDNVHIASGAVLGGGVRIGENTLIGSGAVIIQSIQVGENCIVGSGAVVIKDCIEPGTYVGNPARRRPE